MVLPLWVCNRRSPPAICATAAPSLPPSCAAPPSRPASVRPSVPDTVDRPFSKRANSFDRTNPSRSVTILEDSIAPPIGGRGARNEREKERVSEKDNPETDASNAELEPRSPFLDQNVYIVVQVNSHTTVVRPAAAVGVGMHRPWRQQCNRGGFPLKRASASGLARSTRSFSRRSSGRTSCCSLVSLPLAFA